MRTSVVLASIVLAVLAGPTLTAEPQALEYEQRLRAQEAIERVYYSHQLDVRRPFEEAVPRAVLEKKVKTYLRQSVALEQYWGVEITDAELKRELQRISRQTRFPDRLMEIYTALDHDALLVVEAVVRPALVDRLARRAFDQDRSIHASARWRAEELHRAVLAGQFDRVEKDADSVHEIQRASVPEFPQEPLPSGKGAVSRLNETSDRFYFDVVLEEDTDRTRYARYTVNKTRWDDWWNEVEASFDERDVRVFDITSELPRPVALEEGTRGLDPACIPDGTWDNGVLASEEYDAYRSDGFAAAVWTGSVMIIWGNNNYSDTGQIYNPVLDSWSYTSRVDAPAGRVGHVAVWTGSEMIVQGGRIGSTRQTSGGRYDPLTDTWVATSEVGAPIGRTSANVVWTGSEMLIWGGYDGNTSLDTGVRYDPAADTWAPMSQVNAPAGRSEGNQVWTGQEMIVWGGREFSNYMNSGGRYDPALDSWTPTSEIDAPTGRVFPAAVWTGTEMIVWGGEDPSNLGDGGAYDPVADSWRPLSTSGSPGTQSRPKGVWTGTEMIVWGGDWGEASRAGLYDPVADSWRLSSTSPPNLDVTTRHFMFWTGQEALLWYLGDGARYNPVTDDWTATYRPAPLPDRPAAVGGVWTGNEYIIWGGGSDSNLRNTGARYDPLLDQWTPTTTTGAPAARYGHSVLWTGDEMIAWGGAPTNPGGRYDPVSDSWTAMSELVGLAPRSDHTAIWGGDRMIVWGGLLQQNDLPPDTQEWCEAWFPTDGASYDPNLDQWTPIDGTAQIEGRQYHSVVWAGDRMIVYGGETTAWVDQQTIPGDPPIWACEFGRFPSTGASFRPSAPLPWSRISNVGAPLPDVFNPAVWAGDRMIVAQHAYWPSSNTWSPLSTENAPLRRRWSVLVYTGDEVVEWSGTGTDGSLTATGGRYSLATDTWTPTPTLYAPDPRNGYSGAWTGDFMLVWFWQDGGRLFLGNPDGDGDGVADTCDVCPQDAANDADRDGWCETVDNCDLASNPFQTDTDSDGAGDVCDLCPWVADSDPIDSDDDRVPDACDCQPADPSDFTPSEIEPMMLDRLEPHTASLSWPASAGADLYSVSRGLLSTLAAGSYGGCFVDGIPETAIDDPEPPPSNDGFFYLVQGQNAECGLGELGSSPDESPRWNLDPGSCVGGTITDLLADGELAVAGTVSGSIGDTLTSDDSLQWIQEEPTSGNPSTRYDLLEHRWRFAVPAGGRVELHVEGFRTDGVDGDDFVFEFSTDDGASWTMLGSPSLPFTDDQVDRSLPLAETVSGVVWVRVTDSDRTPGNVTLDTVSIDQLFIRRFGVE